jgi:hypothetical protein
LKNKQKEWHPATKPLIIGDGITKPKCYDKSIKITGATNTKKVKRGKQFAANCLFFTKEQLTCMTSTMQKGQVFLQTNACTKVRCFKRLDHKGLLVSAPSSLCIGDLNSCPPDLELNGLIKWLASGC